MLSVVAAAVEEEDPSLSKQPRAVQPHSVVGGFAVAAACPALLLGARLRLLRDALFYTLSLYSNQDKIR